MKTRIKITIGVFKDDRLKEAVVEWDETKFSKVMKEYLRKDDFDTAIKNLKNDLAYETLLK